MTGTAESEIARLRKKLRIAESQLASSEDERATLEDMAEAAAELRESYQAERDQAMRERDAAQSRYYMAEELERRRLSAQLHDSAGQYITAMRQYAYLIKNRASELSTEDSVAQRIAEYANNIIEYSAHLNDATRTVLHEQWPESLERDGLHAAIEDQIHFWANSAQGMTIQSKIDRLPRFENAIFVFRIAQEWFNNVQRHANASRMMVTLMQLDSDSGRFRCEDDGEGFDPNEVPGRGLSSIRERARSLNATLNIHSTPGCGSTLTLDFPIG